jgi:hypothetical protein
MKNTHIEQQPPAPRAPTAKEVLAQVADNLRKGGAALPVPVEIEAPTIDGTLKTGLSIALCVVEEKLKELAAMAPEDNAAHRVLFALPPIALSDSTAVAVPEMPAQKVVTGDKEVDAVLWLHEVINTGNPDLIAKAKEAAARITTPLKEVQKRYENYLHRAHPGNWVVGLASIGFADLDGLARSATTKALRQQEARARFGENIHLDTDAEKFCNGALVGLDRSGMFSEFDAAEVDARFDALLEQRPGTLSDCLLELNFWIELYWLRNAVHKHSETSEEVHARENYVFRMLSRIPPRDADEAAEVFRYLSSNDGMDRAHTGAIILNLIGAPEPYKANRGDERA